MIDETFEKCLNKVSLSLIVKIIIFLNLIIQMSIFAKYKNNLITKLTKEISTNIVKEDKEDKKDEAFEIGLTDYNLTKFFQYDYFYFNSMTMYEIFKNKYFNITSINYIFSNKFKKVKFEFSFGFYDINKTLILPSDFALQTDISVLCFMTVGKTTIYSLPHIINNKYYKCIEFFNINEKVSFGLYFFLQRRKSMMYINFNFSDSINLTDKSHKKDNIFDENKISEAYKKLEYKTKLTNTYEKYALKRNYMKPPKCELKREAYEGKENWIFANIYNNYFCYCIGKSCVKEVVKQICKYNFYKTVIDSNRNLYPKTEYIFVDFIFKNLPSDDTFPVFEEMIKKNMSAHYITEKKELLNEYCKENKHCQTIIPLNMYNYYQIGDFVEKYLTLILKLKAVISCKQSSFHYVSYLFYKLEYVTYIAVGHGVDFFKDYLFANFRIYGSKINNKILIPPSKILVDLAVKWGWDRKNIIEINLPRWDRYTQPDYNYTGNITSNSILVMFTWRYTKWWEGYRNISELYHENIIKILKNERLHQTLIKNNMTLYFSLHRYVNKKYTPIYDEAINTVDNLKYLEQNHLSECLAKTNLVVSDFSSVIFDLMSRNKPFVIYIPDADDKDMKTFYTDDYIKLIEKMKTGKISFKNKCDTIEETVDKIIKYIKNGFKLEPDLQEFYSQFNFKAHNNTNEFIDYLIHLK